MGIAFLFVIGLCMGSFVNALVWRLHEGRDWVRGRSICPNCKHTLSVRDLVPIASWAVLKGRCRYCRASISKQYPVVELLAAIWFAASYYYWPVSLSTTGGWVLLVTWLVCSVGLLALMLFDHKWMLLPSKIIYSSLAIAVIGRCIYIFGYSSQVSHDLTSWALSVLVASGLFFVIHEVSKGQWIGFGDVRLGLLTGTLIASPSKSLLMIFLASVLGTIFAIPGAMAKKKFLNTRFAYGPFLIVATAIAVLFGQRIIDWYLGFLTK